MKKEKIIKDSIFDKEIELYKKYYEVDEEKKLIRLVFRFNSADEIVEENISTPEKPLIKHSVLEKVSDFLRSLPETYRGDVVLDIKDYGPYKADVLMEAMKDSIEFSHYHSDKEIRRNWVMASLFTLIGLIILLFAAFLSTDTFAWVESTNGAIIKEILDIAAWVFIWEAVSILFLSPSPEKVVENALRIRMHSLSFKNSESVCEENSSYLLDAHPWKSGKVKKEGRYLLLISGFLMIATGIVSIFFLFTSLTPIVKEIINGGNSSIIEDVNLTRSQSIAVLIIATIGSIAVLTFRIIGGIAGVSKFNNRGKFQKMVAPYAIIMLVYHTISFVALSLNGTTAAFGSWFSNGFSVLLNITYLAGYFMDKLG